MGGLSHTVSGDIASFRTPSRVPIESLKFHFLPKQAAGTSSPENPISIEGWTGLNGRRAGKNLIKPYYTEPTTYYGIPIIPTANGVRVTGTAVVECAIRLSSMDVRFLDEGKKYTFSLYVNGDISGCKDPYIGYFDGVSYWGTMGSLTEANNHKLTWTVSNRYATAVAPWFDMHIRIREGSTVDFEIGLQMEAGENVTDYEPYSEELIPITFPDGQTIYGGYIDPVKGKLVATHGIYRTVFGPSNPPGVLGDYERHEYNMNVEFKPAIDLHDNGQGPYNGKTFCNVAFWQWNYFGDSLHYYIDGHRAYIMLPVGTDPNTEIEFCAELATPIEYDIPAQDLKAFLDHNNFWSDANDITEVTYAVTESKDILATRKKAMDFDMGHRKEIPWNQWVQDGNFSNVNLWYVNKSYGSIACSDNVIRWTCTTQPTQYYHTGFMRDSIGTVAIPWNHKILVRAMVRCSIPTMFNLYGLVGTAGNTHTYYYRNNIPANEWTELKGFIRDRPETPPSGVDNLTIIRFKACISGTGQQISTVTVGTTFDVKEYMAFDLTQMFGLGNEPSTVAEFEHICEINGIDLTTYQPYDVGSDRWLIIP